MHCRENSQSIDDFAAVYIAEDERRYIVLVIYDIVDNKRRSRMVKCLERYGVRVWGAGAKQVDDVIIF